MNYACAFSQSELGKYFECIIVSFKDHSSHILGCGTREFCLHRKASSSRALFSVVVTWSTDSPTNGMVVSSAYKNVVAVSTTFG